VGRLRALGIPTPERFCAALAASDSASLAQRIGLAEADLAKARAHAALALHKGTGTVAAGALLDVGVTDVDSLARQEARTLHARLLAVLPPPQHATVRRSRVHAWIRGARVSWLPGTRSAGKGDCR
jgi:hypothetical protein